MFSRQNATSLNRSICLFCSRGCAAFRNSPAALTLRPFCAASLAAPPLSGTAPLRLRHIRSALHHSRLRRFPGQPRYAYASSVLRCSSRGCAAFRDSPATLTLRGPSRNTHPDTCRRFVLIRFLAACAAASSRYPVFPRCCGLSDIPETRIPAQRHRQTSHT